MQSLALWGFGASTMTLQQHSDLAMPQFPKNPQHLKVLKYFVYPTWCKGVHTPLLSHCVATPCEGYVLDFAC